MTNGTFINVEYWGHFFFIPLITQLFTAVSKDGRQRKGCFMHYILNTSSYSFEPLTCLAYGTYKDPWKSSWQMKILNEQGNVYSRLCYFES